MLHRYCARLGHKYMYIPYFLAHLSVGNCLPLASMPEGTIVCSMEEKPGDRGKIAKASG